MPQEEEDDDPATRRGFDALRNNGMTRGEVTAIRGYFSAQVREVSPAGDSVHRRGGLAPPPAMPACQEYGFIMVGRGADFFHGGTQAPRTIPSG